MLRKTTLSRLLTGSVFAVGAIAVAGPLQAGTFTVANQNITLNGGVAGGYFYTTNTDSSKQDNFYLTDFLAELSSETKTGGVGFTAALADFQQVSILDGGVGNAPTSSDVTLLYGYASVAPIDGLKVDIGKLVTNVGYEVPQSFANPNITLGSVWYYEPAYYPGVRATYSWNDMSFYAEINKNDAFPPNDNGVKPGAAVGVSGSLAGFDGSFSYYHQVDQKTVLDFILKKTVATIDLAANLDYQILSDSQKISGQDDSAFGVEFYATVPIMAKVTLPVRVGYVHDGSSQIYALSDGSYSNSSVSFTVTPTYHFTDNTFVRAEFAYITTSKDNFADKNANPKDSKMTLAVQTGVLF